MFDYDPLHPLHMAVGQIKIVHADIETALKSHLRMIAEARQRGADCLLFPELSLTGYDIGPLLPGLGRLIDDSAVQRIAEASGPMATTFGMIEEAAGARLFNSMVTVRDGRVIHVHRKVVPATYGNLEEGKHYGRGVDAVPYHLDGPWHMGVLICNDAWHPPLSHILMCRGATALQVPVASSLEAVAESRFDSPSNWRVLLHHTAMVYGMPVAMANLWGPEGALTFWGGSCIFDPFGTPIAYCGEEETVIDAVIDYDLVRRARHATPTLRDSDAALLARAYARLAEPAE